jgi:hypothetical protein
MIQGSNADGIRYRIGIAKTITGAVTMTWMTYIHREICAECKI